MIEDRQTLERRGPDFVDIAGVAVRAGSVVRLAPRQRSGDIFEVALVGRTAIVHEGERKTASHSSTTEARPRNTARTASWPEMRVKGHVLIGRKSAFKTRVRSDSAAADMMGLGW